MRFIQRLFMNEHQRALADPAQYAAPIPARDIEREIAAGRHDPESREFMQSALQAARSTEGDVTIARVVDQYDGLSEALRLPHDSSLHEFGVCARLGASMLASLMIQRANGITKPA